MRHVPSHESERAALRGRSCFRTSDACRREQSTEAQPTAGVSGLIECRRVTQVQRDHFGLQHAKRDAP